MAEESQYGFKDKKKALDTIELLKSKELAYQKLTVRGLLGRAKRVLTLTKAEEKINNIKSAMEVFEEWIKDHENPSSKSSSKSSSKPEADNDSQKEKVPGLGFKDLAAAENTIKALEGRDPKYQKLAVEGLVKSAKRVLPSTNNPDKQKAIKDATKYLEKWLNKFDQDNRSSENMDYLEIDLMKNLIDKYSFTVEDKLAKEFLDTYENEAKGNYKVLRTMYPKKSSEFKEISWDIIRNKKLVELKESLGKNFDLFDDDDSQKPTDDHFKMIQWAYSQVAQKLKSESKKGKRSHDDDDGSSKKKKK